MADDDHQKIIETVLKLAREQLRENGALDFSVLTLDEQGREGRIDIDPQFFRSDATKDRLTRDLRRDFRKKGIIRYALVAECWMGQAKPIPLVPVRTESLQYYLTRYMDEYRRRGYSQREGGGRDEIVLIQVCDRLRTTLRIWKIDRFPLTGAVRDLVPVETCSDAGQALPAASSICSKAGRIEAARWLKGRLISCYDVTSPTWKMPARSRESWAVCISGQKRSAKDGGGNLSSYGRAPCAGRIRSIAAR